MKADPKDMYNMASIVEREDQSHSAQVLFDKDHSLEEQTIREQFTA